MSPVLLDTGCIVALLDRSERYHSLCASVVAELDSPLITCEAVLAEACYLLRGVEAAVSAVLQNVERGIFQAPYRLTGRAGAVLQLMKKYADVPMDFADACLVDMATHFQTPRILTLDRDFQVYRWAGKRRFEILVEIERG